MKEIKKIFNWFVDFFWLKIGYILFLIILVFPHYHLTETPQAGIDNSWRIGLELAKAKGFVFGKDIIYTYGPLGYLSQRQPIDTPNWQFLLWDIFFFFNIGLLLFYSIPKPTKLFQLVIHFVVFLLISSLYGEWIHFSLFYVGIFIGLKFLETQRLWMLFYSIFIGIVMFFTKANYGIVGLGFVGVLLIYTFLTERLSLKNFGFAIGFVLFLLLSFAFFFKTDLLNYFFGSLHVVSGYNESQSFFPAMRLRLVGASYLVFGLLILVSFFFLFQTLKQLKPIKLKEIISKKTDDIFIIGCVGLISFILIKYAFVRADDGHITAFAKLANLPFLLFPFFAQNAWLKKAGWALFLLNIITYLAFYQPVFGKISFPIFDNLRTKTYIFPQYFKDAFSEKKDYSNPTYPKEILEIIGNKTVDIIPNEISEIYLNRLNYNPRPLLQSYCSYTKYLDTKNQEKYLSDSAPDFLVYGIESTDNKYAFGEETLTLLAILQNYEPVKVFGNRLLLKKKEHKKTLKIIKQSTKKWQLSKEYSLANSLLGVRGFHLLNVKFQYNWWGKLLNLFFQPPHLTMDLVLENGQKSTFRAVPMLLEKGLITNSKIENVADAEQFFQQNYVESKSIKSIRFDEILRKKAGFNAEIEITETYFEIR